MFKEIELTGHGYARGRNGGFVPRKVEFFKDSKGELTLSVRSKKEGNAEPIRLRLPRYEALELLNGLVGILKPEKEPKVAVVIEGGVVQAFLANKPGVHVLVVDYDTEGSGGEYVKKVRQETTELTDPKYSDAFVNAWGQATID